MLSSKQYLQDTSESGGVCMRVNRLILVATEQRLLILVGEAYTDDDTRLEFVTTRVVESKGLIVAFRAPVLADGRTGREEKSPIHVADVVRMSEADLKLRGAQSDSDGVPEHNVDRAVKSNPVNLRREDETVGAKGRVESLESDKRIKFVQRGEKPETSKARADISVPKSSSTHKSGELLANNYRLVTGVPNSSNNPVEISVPKSSSTHKSGELSANNHGLVTDVPNSSVIHDKTLMRSIPSRIVTRYNDASTDADVNEISLHENLLPSTTQVIEDTACSHTQQQLNSTSNVGQGQETFVSYKWGRYEPVIEKVKEPEVVEGKRVRTQRNVFNAGEQGSTLAAMEIEYL